MTRNSHQPNLLDHLLESGFLLWLFCLGQAVILSSELGGLLRNEFFLLLILSYIVFLANIFLAICKYSTWLDKWAKNDSTRNQKNVLITLKLYKFSTFMSKVFLAVMVIIILGDIISG